MGLEAPTRLSLACASLTRDIALLPWQAQLDMQTHRLECQPEISLIRVHPIRSAEILQENGVDDPLWLELVRQHHERLDGTGYPQWNKRRRHAAGRALAGDCQTLMPAMVTPRPNREGRLPEDPLEGAVLWERAQACMTKRCCACPVGTDHIATGHDGRTAER